MVLFTAAWWHAAGQRAAYTALAALIPLAGLLFTGEVTPLTVLSIVGLSTFVSLVTSLKGLPEVDGTTVPLWRAIIVRVLKTASQVGAPMLGSVQLLEQVGWYELGVVVGGAALTTLIRTLKSYLPEDATAPLPALRGADGSYTVTDLPATLGTDPVVFEVRGPEGDVRAHLTSQGQGLFWGDIYEPRHRAGE